MWKEIRISFKMLIVEFQGKSPLGIPTFRWEDAIEMDLRDPKFNELR
jgi:hypothetical protein